MTIQRRMASESPDQFFSQPVLVAAEATLLLGLGSISNWLQFWDVPDHAGFWRGSVHVIPPSGRIG